MKFSLLLTAFTAASGVTAVTKLSQSEAQSRLKAVGISSSSSGGCTSRSNPKCTSYDKINAVTVAGAITLKKACDCSIVITGGTEVGHATGTYSHSNGYKLDFKKASGLNNYIKSNFKKIANRGDGYPQWKAASGNLYCDEGNHWDVTFFSDGKSK